MKTNKNLIIQKITGLSKEQLFLSPEIEEKYEKEINQALKRLNSWEPIEYIIKNCEFFSLDFYVDNRVLIPRDDTELIAYNVLKILTPPALQASPSLRGNFSLKDVWTGTSCVAISIIKNSKQIDKSYVIDISEKALEVSKINIEKHSLSNKIQQINGDLLSPILENNYELNKNLVITANLPYIKDWDYENMDKETVKYEPDLALYWWKENWFELYEKLIKQCFNIKKQYKIETLTLFIEIGFDQKDISKTFLEKQNLDFEYFKDTNNVYRTIKILF